VSRRYPIRARRGEAGGGDFGKLIPDRPQGGKHAEQRARRRGALFARKNERAGDDEKAQPAERLQHQGETAALMQPGDEADRRAGRGEAEEIARGTGAGAPLLAGIFADHRIVHRHLSEDEGDDADGGQHERQAR